MITVPQDYLNGDTKIPNAISKNAGEPENLDLVSTIDKYERELLLSVLGDTQYDELETQLAIVPFTDALQIYQDLVNGKGAWIGLKLLCKNYVYCKYLEFLEVSVTTTGAGKSIVKNHSVTDYNQKYVLRWNEYIDWLYDLELFLENTDGLEKTDNYPHATYKNQFGI